MVLFQLHDDNAPVFVLLPLDFGFSLVKTLMNVRFDARVDRLLSFDGLEHVHCDQTYFIVVVGHAVAHEVHVEFKLDIAVGAAVVASTLLVLLKVVGVVGHDGDQSQAVSELLVVDGSRVLDDGDQVDSDGGDFSDHCASKSVGL